MGKTTVLTSGTSGIGRAIFLKLLKESENNDDKIILNYGHDDVVAHNLIESLSDIDKKKVILVKADMSDYGGIDILVKTIKETSNSIDWLILNTGIGSYKKFDEYDIQLWESVMRTNINVPAFIVQKLKPMMNKAGCIVFMGSHAGQETYSSSLVYSVSKAAVLFMAKSLVKFFDKQEIRVNAIAPGFIETKWQEGRTDESRNNINKKIALHRFGKPEEVAELCYHILENEYLNGSIFDIHGGYNYY